MPLDVGYLFLVGSNILLSVVVLSSPRWWSSRTCAHLLLQELQNYNSLLNNRSQENFGSDQKKIPHIQGQRRSPSKMVGGAKSHLESNPIPTRDAWRAQTKSCAPQAPSPCDRPLLARTSTGDSNTGLAQSLWGLWVLVCTKFCLSPPSISGGYGV